MYLMQKKFKFIIFLYYLIIFGQVTLHVDSVIYLSMQDYWPIWTTQSVIVTN